MIRKLLARTCAAVLVLFMASIFLRAFSYNLFVEKLSLDNIFTRTVFFDIPHLVKDKAKRTVVVDINWAELYPFSNTNAAVGNRLSGMEQLIISIKEVIGHVRKAVESYTGDSLVNRVLFVEWAAKYEKAIGWNFLNWTILKGGVVDIGNGYLSEVVTKYDTAKNSAALAELYDFLRGLAIGFLYVQTPHKTAPADPISGTKDFSNENAGDLLHALSLRHIPYLDLRENIQAEGLDHHALFYKTDHHWKAETGLWASGILADRLNSGYGFNFDPRLVDPREYSYTIYKDWFLGSLAACCTCRFFA